MKHVESIRTLTNDWQQSVPQVTLGMWLDQEHVYTHTATLASLMCPISIEVSPNSDEKVSN